MKAQRGFNLIELLIVVAIIGVLGAIAYPTYQGYTKAGRATAAKQYIMDIANAEETYRADAMTYVAYSSDTAPGALNLPLPEDIAPYYDVDVVATQLTYTIIATPKGGQTGEPVLTLNQAGEKENW